MSSPSFPPLRDLAAALRETVSEMPSSSFPLLRLPVVALREVIEMIELKPLLNLSLCSKRTHFALKNYRRKSPMLLKLFSLNDDVEISRLEEKCSEDEVLFEVGDSSEQIQSTKTLVKFFWDVFAARVKEVAVMNNKIWMLDLVEERQGAFSYDAEVWDNYDSTDEQSRHILLDLNPRSLVFRQITSDEFRLDNFHKKYDNLSIFEGTWMTIENLYQLDCVTLCIKGRNFSNTEVNGYIKHVLSGGAPRLRKFRADIQHANEDVILDGIRELLTRSEQREDELGIWNVKGTVAREEGLMEVGVMHLFKDVLLEIKET